MEIGLFHLNSTGYCYKFSNKNAMHIIEQKTVSIQLAEVTEKCAKI